MEISVADQGAAFLGSLALGAAVGLLYDLFRVLRVRVPVKGLGGVLDLLFWTAVTGALFLYAVRSGNGEVRAFLVIGVLAGSALYFAQLSRIFLRLAYWGADFLAFLGKLCLLPMKLASDLGKKTFAKMKKDFHYHQKWYKINFNIDHMEQMTQRQEFGEGGSTGGQNQESRISDQGGGAGTDRGGAGVSAAHADRDLFCRKRARRAASPGNSSDSGQR